MLTMPSQPVPQGSNLNQLRAYARKQYTYFKYGTSTPSETIFAKIGDYVKPAYQWVLNQLNAGSAAAKAQGQAGVDYSAEKVKQGADKVKEGADKAREEL